jgi:hypothetical protein
MDTNPALKIILISEGRTLVVLSTTFHTTMVRILHPTFYYLAKGPRCIRKLSIDESTSWEDISAILKMVFDSGMERVVWLHANDKSIHNEKDWRALVRDTEDFRETKIYVFTADPTLQESSSDSEEEEAASTPPLEEAGTAVPSSYSSDDYDDDMPPLISSSDAEDDVAEDDEDDVTGTEDEVLESFALQLARVEVDLGQLNIGQCEFFGKVEKKLREKNEILESNLSRMQKELDRANAALDRLGPRVERVLYHLEFEDTRAVEESGDGLFCMSNLMNCANSVHNRMSTRERYTRDWIGARCSAWSTQRCPGANIMKLSKAVVRYGMKNGYFTRTKGRNEYLYGKAEKY